MSTAKCMGKQKSFQFTAYSNLHPAQWNSDSHVNKLLRWEFTRFSEFAESDSAPGFEHLTSPEAGSISDIFPNISARSTLCGLHFTSQLFRSMRSMHDKHTENQSLCLREGLNMLLLLNKLTAVLLPQFSHQYDRAPWTRVAIFWGCSEGSLSSTWLLIWTRKFFEHTALHLTLLFSQKILGPFWNKCCWPPVPFSHQKLLLSQWYSQVYMSLHWYLASLFCQVLLYCSMNTRWKELFHCLST